jgi:hypothetical protein
MEASRVVGIETGEGPNQPAEFLIEEKAPAGKKASLVAEVNVDEVSVPHTTFWI